MNWIVLTFTPNPKQYFDKELNLISTDEQKRKILEAQNVDRVIFLNFTEISNVPAQDFVKEILVDKFKMKYIVVGENFKFGRDRGGDIESLREMAGKFGFKPQLVTPVKIAGTRVSSTLTRENLAAGNIEMANRMLGRSYYIEGLIAEGDKMGRELGFPTINIKTANLLLPEGVFKSKVEIDCQVFDAITNVGFRPTFWGKEKRIESHIFKFDRIVYGKMAKVSFERKLRDEMKFSSKTNLIEQIKKDIENIRV